MDEKEFQIELENRINIIEKELETNNLIFSKKDWIIWTVVVLICFFIVVVGVFI